ncbi:hypothetical protein A2U01_0056238, partial [Trifolium medium]|nr:hypothetical protein [Trifolium medium]
MAKGGDKILTCEKSTNFVISDKEILFVSLDKVGNEEAVERRTKEATVLAVSVDGVERDICPCGGTQGLDEVENSVAIGGERKEDFDLMDPIPDPSNSGHAVMGCSPTGQLVLGCSPADPFELGLQGEDFGSRYTSI